MKILVLGGTGSIGVDLVSILANQENDIWVTSRSKRECSLKNVHYIQGNAHDLGFFRNTVMAKHFDAIVDFMYYKLEELNDRLEIVLNNTKQYIFLRNH